MAARCWPSTQRHPPTHQRTSSMKKCVADGLGSSSAPTTSTWPCIRRVPGFIESHPARVKNSLLSLAVSFLTSRLLACHLNPSFVRMARHPPNLSTSDFWAPSRRLDRKKPAGRRAADAIAYTQTTCSTGVMPTPQSLAPNTMDKPCSPTWQTFTPTQPDKPGKKN
jgi:hypothetical protein